jgi:sugar fermentation stimulation protein A
VLLAGADDDNRGRFEYYTVMKLFESIIPAIFRSRLNRFVVECLLDGKTVRAYLPNPGRLWELLLPGSKLYLTEFPPSSERSLKYMAVAVERDGVPVMLHTHYNNLVARRLIEEGRIPGLGGAEIVKQEHTIGHSRFDFLLRKDNRDVLLEVKSCTLFNNTLAMFPDAITARGTRHLLELAHHARTGMYAAVLFIIHSPKVRYFMPEHHTDLEFSRTLLSVKDQVMVKALSVEWEKDLSLGKNVRELVIPWNIVERESKDSGSYIVVLRLATDRRIDIGGLGSIRFQKGYYLYAGSAKKGLTRRIARHQHARKNLFWHIDYLRQHAEFHAALPVRTSANLECEISRALLEIADWQVPGFGSSDCDCPTHLIGMKEDPVHAPKFIKMLLYVRMGKLEEELENILSPRMYTDGHG